MIGEECELNNLLMGRFTTIEDEVVIDSTNYNFEYLSNHSFTYEETDHFPHDDYFQEFLQLRNFYENEKYTIIGNDVLIKKKMHYKIWNKNRRWCCSYAQQRCAR